MTKSSAVLAIAFTLASPLVAVRSAAVPASPDVVAVDSAPTPVAVSLTPDVTLVGADPTEVAAVDEALVRFREHGLELPDLEVHFFDDEADCGGHPGLFRERSWHVLVCSDLAFVVTHELAHAWEAANLDDRDREAYRVARDLPTWDGGEHGWNERAVEDAAFVVQQTLMTDDPDPDSDRWRDLAAAFELLTGNLEPGTH